MELPFQRGFLFLSCQVFLIKELVDKVLLALTSDLASLVDTDMAVCMLDVSLFDFKQT